MKESAFEKKFMDKAKRLPASYWQAKEHPSSVRGVLDRTGCIGGRFIALEFKRALAAALAKSSTRPLQLHTQHKIQAAGGYAVTVYPENAESIFNDLRSIAMGRYNG